METESTTLTDSTPYYLVDSKTGALVKEYTYAQRKAARNRLDRMDIAYGACRYVLTFRKP